MHRFESIGYVSIWRRIIDEEESPPLPAQAGSEEGGYRRAASIGHATANLDISLRER
jgi:hypothetical protein